MITTNFNIHKLAEYAVENGLHFSITYSEACDEWDIELSGAAVGEDFCIRKAGDLQSAIEWIIEDANIFYNSLHKKGLQ